MRYNDYVCHALCIRIKNNKITIILNRTKSNQTKHHTKGCVERVHGTISAEAKQNERIAFLISSAAVASIVAVATIIDNRRQPTQIEFHILCVGRRLNCFPQRRFLAETTFDRIKTIKMCGKIMNKKKEENNREQKCK